MSSTSGTTHQENISGNGQTSTALIFEVAWEVCCQAGGIYTVLRSKAPAAVRRWGDSYWLMGPYREPGVKIEFEPIAPTGVVKEAIDEVANEGMVIHAGRWLVTGRPQVLLVDLDSIAGSIGQMKYFFWKDHGIGVPDSDWEVNGIIGLGYVTAAFLSALHRRVGNRPLLAHFHEWQGGAALPILKHRQAQFATVFTTHATLVGRSLSSANADLYDNLAWIDGEAVASQHQFWHRYAIEKAAAQCADVFTTVSEITALEAAQFLGRKPEVLLPNGLNIDRFSAPYQFQNLHRQNKERIHEFVMGHFFPSYTFDLDRTLYIFTAGRYEYRNKGIDLFIEALFDLNMRLRARPDCDVTVVAFIIAPAAYRSLNVTTLNRQAMFDELRKACTTISQDMGRRLFQTVARGQMPTTDDLLDEYARVRLLRMMHAWRKGPPPPIVTHDLVDDGGDAVLRHLRHRGLINREEDRVKVVFHPEFISSTSPVLGLEYDQFVRGCNLGVFPSYYEPWGYTPMECVVRGIPAITSDLSGFGAYVMTHFPDHDRNGIYVARRRGVSFQQTTTQISDWLYGLTQLNRRERIELRNRVERHAEHFDWTNLTRYYWTARSAAFSRHYAQVIRPDVVEEVAEPPSSFSFNLGTDRAQVRRPSVT